MVKKVTFKGSPLSLAGRSLKVNMQAPDFKIVNQDMKEISLNDFKDKIKIIGSFISLDTSVCDMEIKEINKQAGKFPKDVELIAVSKDLPFAQKKYCESFQIKNIGIYSDYKMNSLGFNLGLLIKEWNLLARSVIILDRKNTIRYIDIVDEISHLPHVDNFIKNLTAVIKEPEILALKEEIPTKCVPCEGKVAPLPMEKVNHLLKQVNGWELVEDKKITKEFKFIDFLEAKMFIDLLSAIADSEGHHPSMTIIYNKVKVTLTTHAAKGLTDNDFTMARTIDQINF